MIDNWHHRNFLKFFAHNLLISNLSWQNLLLNWFARFLHIAWCQRSRSHEIIWPSNCLEDVYMDPSHKTFFRCRTEQKNVARSSKPVMIISFYSPTQQNSLSFRASTLHIYGPIWITYHMIWRELPIQVHTHNKDHDIHIFS